MSDPRAPDLQGCRLLIIEDEYMIASDLARVLQDQGAEVVGPAGTVADAIELLAGRRLDGAVLDINLGDEMVFPVADRLLAEGVPFVFATGYDAVVVPTAYADVPRLEKPIETATLSHLLARRIEDARLRGK